MPRIGIPKTREEKRIRRHLRVRKKVTGTPERPRLVVYRSLKHIYAQLVDDVAQRTLVTVSSRKVVAGQEDGEGNGGREGRRRACESRGDHAGRLRSRGVQVSRPSEGSGRRRPRRRLGVLSRWQRRICSTG